MNKIKKVVGASVMGAMMLVPAGSASATMTAANVENFYNMPITLAQIGYDDYMTVVFRKRVQYLNMVAIKPGYTEEYADEHYETMGLGEVEWGRTIFNGDLGGFPAGELRYIMTEADFHFYEDNFGLIYYALEFKDGGHYEGKISYTPCKEAFASGNYSSSEYECRIYYKEEKTALSGDETYMSSYTEAKYTGGNEVMTSYAYRLEPKSQPLTGLPADVDGTSSGGAAIDEATWQEFVRQYNDSLEEIERLRGELATKDVASAEQLENLRAELTAVTEAQLGEIDRLKNELSAQDAANTAEVEELMAEIAEREAAFAAEKEKWQAELAEKETEWRTELTEKETEWQAELTGKEAGWQAELAAQEAMWRAKLAEKEEAWQAQIEQKKQEIAKLEAEMVELEAAKSTEIGALNAQLSELKTAKEAEISVLKSELENLERAKATELAAVRAELAELETKMIVAGAQVELSYAGEMAPTEKAVTAGMTEVAEGLTESAGDEIVGEETVDSTDTDSAEVVDLGVEAEENTPELEKGSVEKPWWIIPSVAAVVCGLAYWWLAADTKLPSIKLKRKK